LQELRVKAKYFEESNIIPTLDACCSVAKSDTLVPSELHEALRTAFVKLKESQAANPDWHPNSDNMVQDLVHPSMYSLVYGRSLVVRDERVGVTDAVEKWSGKGDIIEKEDIDLSGVELDGFFTMGGGSKVPPHFWSSTYQWLPANVALQENGSVKFTSYINNLHPVKHAEIYRTIEELIKISLPMWDQCLVVAHDLWEREGTGRTKCRMTVPEKRSDEDRENWIPSDPQEYAHVEVDWEKEKTLEYDPEWDDETELKWELFRKPRIPRVPFEDNVSYTPLEHLKLSTKFKETGLQIICKLASIELTPEKPDFPAGGWHVEGQMNEHIAATALYYLDSENVTDSRLSFRMQTDTDSQQELQQGQDQWHWLEHIYGTDLGDSAPCLQNYGSVETRQGRLLAFPNVFHHRVSSFSLLDKTKPGHRRFIALWLVDPHQRIISTANVPPQQQDWWLESIFGTNKVSQVEAASKIPPEILVLIKDQLPTPAAEVPTRQPGSLPPEMMEMVRSYFDLDSDTLPMSLEEAKEHRLELMKERGAFVKLTKDSWNAHSYNFCEH
jgi:hypothetical protein